MMKKWLSLVLSLILLISCFPMEALAVEEPAVTKVSLLNIYEGVKVSWKAVEGAESYRVYRRIPGEKWLSLKKDITALKYTDTSAEYGSTYQYAVRVYNEAGSSWSYSSEIFRVAQPTAKATNVYNGIKITWDEVEFADSYDVYRKSGSESWSLLGSTEENSYLDKTAKAGVNYSYQARAKIGNSASSNKQKVTLLRLEKPEVSRYNVYEGVRIKWNAVSGAETYRVYRKAPGGSYTLLKKNITSLSYTDTTAKEGETYIYAVRSYDSTGGSAYAAAAQVVRVLQPQVSAVNKRAGVKLTWDAVDFADSYNVYRKKDGGEWILLKNTTKLTYTDSTALDGVKYSYRVRAKKGTVLSSDKLKDEIIRLDTPDTTVSAVYAGVSVKWEKVEGADSYYVYRKVSGGSYKLLQKGVTELKFTDTTAVSGKTYIYAVRSYKKGHFSSYGAAKEHQHLSRPALTAKAASKTSIKLTWDAVTGAQSYIIYVKNDAGELKKFTTVKNTSYTASNLVFGKKYSFAVRAVGSLNNSTKSAVKSATPTFPAMNCTLTLVPGKGVKVSWKAVTGAASYRVYRRTENGEWKLLKTTTSKSYTDTSGRSGVTYYYTVRAYELADAKGTAGVRGEGKKIVYTKVDPNKPMIALTFDDGPSGYTEEILDVLEKYDARATFFVVGNRVNSYKSTIKRAYDMGCEIGNHSWSHPYLPGLSVSGIKEEISSTDRAVKAITGEEPALIRPPYGGVDSTVSKYAGKPLINWSVDTRDWETQSSSSTYYSIMNDGYDGSIILMHDIYYATKEGAIRAIPQLIDKGYQLVTVSELAAYRGVNMKDGTVYYQFKP